MPPLLQLNEVSSELDALIRLLDDSDPHVTTSVQRRLIEYRWRAVPHLQAVLAASPPDSPRAVNAQACLRAIRTNALATLLDRILDACAEGSDIPLEESLTLLSIFGCPDGDPGAIGHHLDTLWLDVERALQAAPTRSEVQKLLALNTVVFDRAQFRGAGNDYHTPHRIYLAPVLQHRQGIPITLSCIYMLIAARAGIELWGIGMPLHFVVYSPALEVYIDPFNAGTFISREECCQFIEQAGFRFSESMLMRRSNVEILQRVIRNAIYAHTKSQQQWEAETLQETLETIERLTKQP
jgi:regulator of sirC expression with transglutaminase-like and TPR domain